MKTVHRLLRRVARWKYVILTYRDYANRLNRSVDVENTLLSYADGKRGALSQEECRELAYKLGVPKSFRAQNSPNQPCT